jgi:hypothetical protein
MAMGNGEWSACCVVPVLQVNVHGGGHDGGGAVVRGGGGRGTWQW